MFYHEESPENPQYNMATPRFALPPFSSKNFQTSSFPSILKKSNCPLEKIENIEKIVCSFFMPISLT